jgi:hypothetical protein
MSRPTHAVEQARGVAKHSVLAREFVVSIKNLSQNMRLLDLSNGVSMVMAPIFRAVNEMRVLGRWLFSNSGALVLGEGCSKNLNVH